MKVGIGFLVLLLVCASLMGCAAEDVPAVAPDLLEPVEGSAPVDTPKAVLESPEAEATATAVKVTAQAAADITPPPSAKKAVDLAIQDLAESEGIDRASIHLVSVESVEWSDASLGCPEPDMVYAQVITPGFLVMLEAKGDTYEYHTDAGRFVVLCQPGD